jgi:hypothetical protein
MHALLSEALRLQTTARQLVAERETGITDKEAHEEKTVAWVLARHRFASMEPESDIDALAVLHSLRQAANALTECREQPDAIIALASELLSGMAGVIGHIERTIGTTRDELALFEDYGPSAIN